MHMGLDNRNSGKWVAIYKLLKVGTVGTETSDCKIYQQQISLARLGRKQQKAPSSSHLSIPLNTNIKSYLLTSKGTKTY